MAKVVSLLEKMGLVRTETQEGMSIPAEPMATQEPSPPPQPIVRQVITPSDRALEAVAAEAAAAGSPEYPFEQIYASAGIQAPAHGFTVEKLVELMEAEELRGLDDATRAKVLSGMLRRLPGGPVALEDIVRDAALRDQALDAFERFLADRTARAEAELTEANRKLQAEIDELARRNTEQIEANRAHAAAERARLDAWRARKLREEERLFAAVQPFVADNPVSLTAADPAEAPQA